MSKKVFLCKSSEIREGVPFQVCHKNYDDPFLLHKVGGELYLTDNLCTHGLVSLSEGELVGTTIYCPLHGGAFDVRNGNAVELPCKKALKTYPVEMVDGDVFGSIE